MIKYTGNSSIIWKVSIPDGGESGKYEYITVVDPSLFVLDEDPTSEHYNTYYNKYTKQTKISEIINTSTALEDKTISNIYFSTIPITKVYKDKIEIFPNNEVVYNCFNSGNWIALKNWESEGYWKS